MKYRPVGAELFHVDGRTDGRRDMRKLIVVFFAMLGTHLNVAATCWELRNRFILNKQTKVEI